MRNPLLIIITLSILVILSLALTASISCQKEPVYPKMSAPEVLQYVNQALTDEYVYQTPLSRFEYRYSALSAEHMGDGMWQVSVRVVEEHQIQRDGQWMPLYYTGRGSNEELAQQIRALSPEALVIFKQQLPQRLRELSPEDREAALSTIRGIPGFDDVITEFESTRYLFSEVTGALIKQSQ